MESELVILRSSGITVWDKAISSALAKGQAVDIEAPSQLVAKDLNLYFGRTHAVKNLSLSIPTNRITAIIGPSGCGKSTFLRSMNRMHEVVPGARMEGQVLLDGEDIYAPSVDPVEIRRRIGMVFQRPNPFPTMSIYENAVCGLRLNGVRDRRVLDEVAERSLRHAALWGEVKDVLGRPGTSLSGGQQQRLCIARALAVQPEVLLMDEPASALDPVSTLKIEELAKTLRETLTIVIVTHNMQQAARVSDGTAFMLHGELIEYGPTSEMFTRPREKQTEDYITGRFG
ncbi:MAG TPA: phosphate ABC transporter ATP-binding protein PstB [bacterium]|nr:phosphate ABC transporter ATP-binding protein PstB [bacterium]